MLSHNKPIALGLTSVLEKQPAPRDSQVIHVDDEMDEKPCTENLGLHHSGKENLPISAKLEHQKNIASSVLLREVDQLRKQLATEKRLRAKAEAQLVQQPHRPQGSGTPRGGALLDLAAAGAEDNQSGEGEPRSEEKGEEEEVSRLCEQVRMLRAKLLEFVDQRLLELDVSEQEFKQLSNENKSLRTALREADEEGCKLKRLTRLEEDLSHKMATVSKELERLQHITAKNEAKVMNVIGKLEKGDGEPTLRGNKEDEAEELLQQNAELLLTVQQLKQDAELLELENRSLRELTATEEYERSRLPTQHSHLTGQAHNKQKARYIAQLKEENVQLNRELKKVRNSLRQLQVSSRSENLLEALLPLVGLQPRVGGSGGNATTGAAPTTIADAGDQPCRTPCRTPRRRSVSAHGRERDDLSGALTPARGCTEGLQNRCREYERVLERVSIDFRHFLLLIERVLSAGGTLPGAVSMRGPGRQESVMAGKEDVSHLLRQLRDSLGKELQHSKAASSTCTPTEG